MLNYKDDIPYNKGFVTIYLSIDVHTYKWFVAKKNCKIKNPSKCVLHIILSTAN